jgi:ubiquinone/menaquinone biosynthesis C-methylase UbiE
MAVKHQTAKSSHYNKEADHYDKFNEEKSKIINHTIENILEKHAVKTVLDLTCGTGSQLFWLIKHGFRVIGCDINGKMLKIAKDKAQQEHVDLTLKKGDMRTVKVGIFDSVITIFNAVGHLTKNDFELAMRNVSNNLKTGGLYIFDIFNLDYFLHESNITHLTIDWQTTSADVKARKIQYSTIDQRGILASYTLVHEEKEYHKPKITKSVQTLQIYTAEQLKDMLERNGFKVIDNLAIDGSTFDTYKTDRLLVVAKKNC